MIISVQPIGEKIMKAFRLEGVNVVSITINILPNEFVTADVRIALDSEQLVALGQAVSGVPR